MTASVSSPEWVVDRYQVFDEIASGGMATVYYGRLLGPVGFSRVVAIKRLHPHLAKDPEFVAMFIDEARMAAKIRHPNVVPMLDVVATDEHLLLVMEYVQGETLARLIRKAQATGEPIPPPIAASIVVGALYGLHAAHEAKGDTGEPLGLVHRDVSPQNIVVGTDGIARVLDFGIAKASGRLQTTREGRLKGKLAYMAPEHVRGDKKVSRAADIYAASVVLWEALTGERLFDADNDAELLEKVLSGRTSQMISEHTSTIPGELQPVVLRGLALDPAARYATAHEMARDIERKTRVASAGEVSEWVEKTAADGLAAQARKLAEIASRTDISGEVESGPKSEARPTTGGPSRSRRWVLPLFAVVLAGAGVVAWRHHRSGVTAAPAPDPVASASAAASADPDDGTQTVEVEVDNPQSSNGAGAGAHTTVRRRVRVPPRSGIVREFPAAKSQCNPPYVIDAQGVKHYKVECL
ncbi:MAG TPA: serine/threonine-protein kinase [Polyangiaceae bacterium]|nr:serine/threonine-protein kinase [Polyangiaceae bacterium]